MTWSGSRRLPALAVAALALLACGLVALEAQAKPRVASTVTLNTAHEGKMFVFTGKVSSERAKCRRNRKVTITAGNFDGADPIVEGVTRTNRRGRYRLEVEAALNTIGRYQAIAARKETRNFICKPARSEIE